MCEFNVFSNTIELTNVIPPNKDHLLQINKCGEKKSDVRMMVHELLATLSAPLLDSIQRILLFFILI